jgi:erythronate-4-phosphate dehydrogenase
MCTGKLQSSRRGIKNDVSRFDYAQQAQMKIIIDNKIPYIRGALEPFAEVIYLPGSATTSEVVKDADALITRTRTICNKEILEGSQVRFIATATIGFDHIDSDFCRDAGIEWTNAPGCNAESVNQYISSALFSWALRNGVDLAGKTTGIVGVGEVGSRIERSCKILGMNVLLNDPPRERVEGPISFVSLQEIQEQADIISFHVPLNMEGIDRTYHMVNGPFLQKLGKKPLIINTCRGEVFESKAVYQASVSGRISGMIIDCWENEPALDLELLDRADYGTAHIAGYSKDGKANGTRTSVRAISQFFGLGIDDWEPAGVPAPENPVIELDGDRQSEHRILAQAILSTYDIECDDRALRDNPHLFEQLRGDYPLRREFNSYSIRAVNVGIETMEKLRKLGFKELKA